jgi:hypothetical protein
MKKSHKSFYPLTGERVLVPSHAKKKFWHKQLEKAAKFPIQRMTLYIFAPIMKEQTKKNFDNS